MPSCLKERKHDFNGTMKLRKHQRWKPLNWTIATAGITSQRKKRTNRKAAKPHVKNQYLPHDPLTLGRHYTILLIDSRSLHSCGRNQEEKKEEGYWMRPGTNRNMMRGKTHLLLFNILHKVKRLLQGTAVLLVDLLHFFNEFRSNLLEWAVLGRRHREILEGLKKMIERKNNDWKWWLEENAKTNWEKWEWFVRNGKDEQKQVPGKKQTNRQCHSPSRE